MEKINVFYEATPNPDSMKFIATVQIAEATENFADPTLSAKSPLAAKLFGFLWAQAIMIGPNFVTVTKQDWVEWEILADPLCQLIEEHLNSGEPVLLENLNTTFSDDIDANDSIVVQQIKKILNQEIRPVVALDGGDIVFDKYENQKLYVKMQGACSGCPSSTATLKQGVEARLKSKIPELTEVVSV